MNYDGIRKAIEAAVLNAGADKSLADDLSIALERVGRESSNQTPPGTMLIGALSEFPEEAFATPGQFDRRAAIKFETRAGRTPSELSYVDRPDPGRFVLSPEVVLHSIVQANVALLALHQFTSMLRVPISELLGMRNLSSLVSSVLVSEVHASIPDDVYVNPHQDGYPDLIPRTDSSNAYYDEMKAAGRMSDKSAWTSTTYGGIEVKATCGNTPSASRVAKRGLGETRADIVVGFDWKAHHRETSRLLSAIWDFVDGVPTVTAGFYRNDLTEEDWGRIVSPKEGGGRTTSVSIMTRTGIMRMADGWMVRTTDKELRTSLERGRMIATAFKEAIITSGLLEPRPEDVDDGFRGRDRIS